MSKFSRNDPCPCGSGKKYKKCCLALDTATRQHVHPNSLAKDLRFHPELEEQLDQILQRLEAGAGRAVEAELTTLLMEYPDYHTVQYAMGVFHGMVLKDGEGAIPYFERAVALQPNFAEAHYNLGGAARQIGEVVKSVDAYRAAIRHSQTGDQVAQLARRGIQDMEKIVLTTTHFKSLEAYVANARLFDEAFVCLHEQKFDRAVSLFRLVLVNDPDHVQTYGNLGLALAGLGQRANALASLDRALELDPAYAPARGNRAVIEKMKEGESFLPEQFKEIKYYLEKAREEA